MVNKMPRDSVKAYVLASVKQGSERDAAKKLGEIKGVIEVLITYGMWDLIARIETESLEKLNNIINNIRQLSEIEQTNTLIGAN
jgi:DNA-binding Lrp family transcriptional regulator